MAKRTNITGSPADENAQILALINEVKRRKKEIESIEKPAMKTNLTFTYSEDGKTLNNSINLLAESSVATLIKIGSFLMSREASYEAAADELDVENPPPFTWQGSSIEDWLHDLKLRVDRIQIASKKQKLEDLEARLNNIITPDLRRKMELEAITNDLSI